MQYSYTSVTHTATLALLFSPFPLISLFLPQLTTHSYAHFHFPPTTSSWSALPFIPSIPALFTQLRTLTEGGVFGFSA